MSMLPVKAMFMLAWRNLWRNHRRTTIMLAAITVGVWAMIFMTALMRGMVDDMLLNGIRSLPGEVQIHHPEYRDDPSINNSIAPPGAELLKALQIPQVTAWTSRVRVPAVISSERDTRGVILLGIEPGSEQQVSFDADTILEGRFLEDSSDKGLVIGAKMADHLETDLGKRVVVMSQDPDNNIADRGFRIVGIYRAKLASLEETYIYAGRDTVQKLLKLGDGVSEIAITGDDYRNAEQWYPRIKQAAGEGVETLPWYEVDTYLGSMLAMMGESAPAETQSAEQALRVLGGHLNLLVPVILPGVVEERYLVVVDKVAASPQKYPRRAGIPGKRPL
jgi:ABC-type lipoprotein release transport system permease subunit